MKLFKTTLYAGIAALGLFTTSAAQARPHVTTSIGYHTNDFGDFVKTLAIGGAIYGLLDGHNGHSYVSYGHNYPYYYKDLPRHMKYGTRHHSKMLTKHYLQNRFRNSRNGYYSDYHTPQGYNHHDRDYRGYSNHHRNDRHDIHRTRDIKKSKSSDRHAVKKHPHDHSKTKSRKVVIINGKKTYID